MSEDTRDGIFLIVDGFPNEARNRVYSQLRHGQFYIEQLHTKESGKSIQVPGGLIHHWVGVAFIPGTTLAPTLVVLQDYDHHKDVYKPDVRRSRLLAQSGNEFRVYLQLYRKSLVTLVVNVNLDIQYTRLGNTRAISKSCSTRIAEVENAGKSNEHELSVGNDHGYIWRLCSYWRIEEKDGGVYAQVESIGLSRTIPGTISWLVNPLVRSIPKSVLSRLLNATRTAVANESGSRPVSWQDPEEDDRALLFISTPNIFADTVPNLLIVDISQFPFGGAVTEVAEGNWNNRYTTPNKLTTHSIIILLRMRTLRLQPVRPLDRR